MRRRTSASTGSSTLLSETWAFGRRYRRLSQRIRKPIAMTAVLAVLMTFTGPTAFAEDSPRISTTETESPSPAPEPSPSPAAETDPSPSPEPSAAPIQSPSASAPTETPETSSVPTVPTSSPTISSDKDDYPPGGAVSLDRH